MRFKTSFLVKVLVYILAIYGFISLFSSFTEHYSLTVVQRTFGRHFVKDNPEHFFHISRREHLTSNVTVVDGAEHFVGKPGHDKRVPSTSSLATEKGFTKKNSTTPNILKPWQNVSDFQATHTNGTIYVYSAHYNDIQYPSIITLVGLGVLKTVPSHVICRYEGSLSKGKYDFEPVNMFSESNGSVVLMPDHHSTRYVSIYIHCNLPPNMARPKYVSVIEDKNKLSLNNLTITYPERGSGQPRWQIALCLSPLHGKYNKGHQVLETLEFARLLGADHAFVYITSVGPDVSRLFQHYADQGFLRMRTWHDPPEPVWYHGQMAAINDCLLRLRYQAKLLVFMDLDEMIVPHQHNNWADMLEHIRHQAGKNVSRIGAYTFRNVYFYWSAQSVPEANSTSSPMKTTFGAERQFNLTEVERLKARKLNLITAMKEFRTEFIWSPPFCMKNIVDPLKVTVMGIHYPREYVQGYEAVLVDPSIALLHHYRYFPPKKSIKDTSALKFTPELIKRIEKTIQELSKTKNITI